MFWPRVPMQAAQIHAHTKQTHTSPLHPITLKPPPPPARAPHPPHRPNCLPLPPRRARRRHQVVVVVAAALVLGRPVVEQAAAGWEHWAQAWRPCSHWWPSRGRHLWRPACCPPLARGSCCSPCRWGALGAAASCARLLVLLVLKGVRGGRLGSEGGCACGALYAARPWHGAAAARCAGGGVGCCCYNWPLVPPWLLSCLCPLLVSCMMAHCLCRLPVHVGPS